MTETHANDFFTITQYAQETERGTPVAAATIWPGTAPKIISDVKPNFIEEQFNIRAKTRRVQVQTQMYLNSLVAPEAGFQQLLLPLQCGLKGVAAAEQSSGQSDYLWNFTPGLTPTAGDNAPKAATLEFTDGVQAYEAEYCMFDKISIKGSIPQDGSAAPVSVEGSFFGRRIQPTTLTADLSLAALTPMNAALARLYMDAAWASLPTAQVETATVVGTITGSGTATVIVTASGMTGSPKTLNVAVLQNDTAAVVAGKIRTALLADSAVTALFSVGGTGATVVLTRLTPAANDATLNISIDNGTCSGLTPAGTSADTTAGVAGTELAGLLRGFEIQILTGVHPVFRGSANPYFSAHREGYVEASATFTIEGGTTAHALLAAHQTPTFKVFRLQVDGPRIGSGMYHRMQFDIGGYLEAIAPNDNSDRGDNLATFGMKSTYDATGAKGFLAKILTNQNAV